MRKGLEKEVKKVPVPPPIHSSVFGLGSAGAQSQEDEMAGLESAIKAKNLPTSVLNATMKEFKR